MDPVDGLYTRIVPHVQMACWPGHKLGGILWTSVCLACFHLKPLARSFRVYLSHL